MRKFLMCTLILLVSAAWAVAQQGSKSQAPPAGSSSQASSSASASAETNVEGCLGGSAGNYTVTDKSGKSYRLQLPANADTTSIDKHIGQEVRVAGTVSNSSAAAPAPPSSGASSNASTGAPSAAGQASIMPTKMQGLGTACSSKPGETPMKK